jgi:hypothetical protein
MDRRVRAESQITAALEMILKVSARSSYQIYFPFIRVCGEPCIRFTQTRAE